MENVIPQVAQEDEFVVLEAPDRKTAQQEFGAEFEDGQVRHG